MGRAQQPPGERVLDVACEIDAEAQDRRRVDDIVEGADAATARISATTSRAAKTRRSMRSYRKIRASFSCCGGRNFHRAFE